MTPSPDDASCREALFPCVTWTSRCSGWSPIPAGTHAMPCSQRSGEGCARTWPTGSPHQLGNRPNVSEQGLRQMVLQQEREGAQAPQACGPRWHRRQSAGKGGLRARSPRRSPHPPGRSSCSCTGGAGTSCGAFPLVVASTGRVRFPSEHAARTPSKMG